MNPSTLGLLLFYNNLHVGENERVSTYLLGHHIPITDSIIYNLIGIMEKERGCYFKG